MFSCAQVLRERLEAKSLLWRHCHQCTSARDRGLGVDCMLDDDNEVCTSKDKGRALPSSISDEYSSTIHLTARILNTHMPIYDMRWIGLRVRK